MITKAIIPVAGWGTRRLPITKSIEKSMLPIGNRPIVDYVVQDCIKAGITDIYFVVSEGSVQLRQYYSNNNELNEYLINTGKNDAIKLITLPEAVNFHYVEQPSKGKYGTAIPVSLAAKHIFEGESAVIVGGDDFIYNADDSSEIKRLIDATPENGNSMLASTVTPDQVNKYGVIEVSDDQEFIRIVEKPDINEAPSNLINITKYILNRDAIEQIVQFVQTDQPGEYYITDAINDYIRGGGSMKVVAAKGEYLDGGTLEGWLYANKVVLGDLA